MWYTEDIEWLKGHVGLGVFSAFRWSCEQEDAGNTNHLFTTVGSPCTDSSSSVMSGFQLPHDTFCPVSEGMIKHFLKYLNVFVMLILVERHTAQHQSESESSTLASQTLSLCHKERKTERERQREKSSLYMRYNKKGSSYWEGLKPPVVRSVHFSTRGGTLPALCPLDCPHEKHTPMQI